MRKWSKVAIIFLATLLIALGCIMIYGQETTLPKGVSIPLLAWDVGGMELEQFREQLSLQVAQLAQLKIDISVALETLSTARELSEWSGLSGLSDLSDLSEPSELSGLSVADGASTSLSSGELVTASTSLSSNELFTASTSLSSNELVSSQTFTLQQLGLVLEVDDVLQQVEAIFSGTIWNKAIKRWTSRHETIVMGFDFNANALNKLIDDHWKTLQSSQPTNAERIITANDKVTYRSEKTTARIDVTQLRLSLIDWLDKQSKRSINDNESQNESERQPQPQNVIPSLIAPLQTIHPNITVESLVQQGVERKIVEYTTRFSTSGAGRVHNIQATAATIHDRLMKPGELFDFSEVVKTTEQEIGFKQAPVIIDGKFVPGIGGGICQVSTTLYNAVLRGGFEIVERKNHSLPVRYVPLGQDATFASGHINFKFRNHLDSYTLIRIETSNDHITVKLFSSLPEGITYDIHSTIAKTIEPPKKYVHNPNLPKGTTKLIRKGKTGFIVDTYRTTKQNGQTIHTEKISQDHYQAQPSLIATHPQNSAHKKPNQQSSPKKRIIEDGVSGPVFNNYSDDHSDSASEYDAFIG